MHCSCLPKARMSSSSNSKENLKNMLDQVRDQIQEMTNYIDHLRKMQEDHDHDTTRERFEATNRLYELKDKESKLEDQLMDLHGVSYRKFF